MFDHLYLHQQQFSLQLRKESLETRLEYLKTLEILIDSHQKEFCEALKQDFAKPEMETLVSEIYPLIMELTHTQKKLEEWMKPVKVSSPLFLKGSQSFIQYEPRGVCLIIAPWNYPIYLLFGPLISAIAAGNTAVLKPSEFTTNTSALISRLIKGAFSEEHIAVVEGGAETTQSLLKQPFDHIFFTGSTAIGKLVMRAAAEHLSSVTLELGGKTPTIIDSTADLELAAEKVLWAKFLNAGQTCVAPDYLFVQESIFQHFTHLLKKKLEDTYGKDRHARKSSSDFARIISSKHLDRLKALLDEAVSMKGNVIFGGEVDVNTQYLSPTLIEDVDPHSRLMNEEIFGPILPLLTFSAPV